jgi:hypothetical protein
MEVCEERTKECKAEKSPLLEAIAGWKRLSESCSDF